MPRNKTKVLSVRTSDQVNALLRLAADKEHRSISSMIEHMVYEYTQRYGIQLPLAPDEESTLTK